MQKKDFILLVVLLLIISTPVFADQRAMNGQGKEGIPLYNAATVYPGIYRSTRLYQFDTSDQAWYANWQPKLWAKLPCREAREALSKGEWVGLLTDSGACAGHEEAPKYAAGNYLNYLIYIESSAAKQSH